MKKLLHGCLCVISLFTSLKLQSADLSIITLSHKELHTPSTQLDTKLRQAARQGFFYLEIPEHSLNLIPDAVNFGNTFYKNDYFTTLQLAGYNGYKTRENVQAEGFYCEQSLWHDVYSHQIAQLAQHMKKEADYILQKLLRLVLPQLSTDTLHYATDGLSEGNGLYHLSFKHYRPEKNAIGLTPHRDFGYITILYIDKKGLHAKIDGAWHPIPPRDGYFIVNFGRSLELLVNNQNLLNASWHYVEQITHEKHGGDRMSFALFSGCNLDAPLHRTKEDGALEIVYTTYKEFVDAGFKDVYDNPDLSDID